MILWISLGLATVLATWFAWWWATSNILLNNRPCHLAALLSPLVLATVTGITAQLAFNITDDDFTFITAAAGPMQRFVIGGFVFSIAVLLTALTLGVVYLVAELPKRGN